MNIQKDPMTLIRERRSTRKFNLVEVRKTIKDELQSYMEELNNDRYRFLIVDYKGTSGGTSGEKIGTYGFIRNAVTYIVAVGKDDLGKDNQLAIQFGYDFEKIILKATELDLKTCWMGMSYQEKKLLNKCKAANDERIVMISPIGYSDKKGFVESAIRIGIKADKRLDPDQIFFQDKLNQPITSYHDPLYKEVLEMVRLAPSAGNAQPWRIVQVDGGYDFYIKSKKFYDQIKDKRIDFAHNDLGIAKLHFELAAKQLGLKGSWQNEALQAISGERYVFSWSLGQ